MASGPAWAEIDTGVPGATVTLRVHRYEDPEAIRSQDFSAYITPGEGNPYPGLKWEGEDQLPR